MIDPQIPQVPSPAPSSARRFGGVAVAIGATSLMLGGLAWPALRGELPTAASTLEAAGPAPLVNGGPITTSYADVVNKVSPAVVMVRSSRVVQQTSMGRGQDNPFRRFFGEGEGDEGD